MATVVPLALIAAAVVAVTTAAAASTWLARNAIRIGLVDVPNSRSAHDHSMPRGGGIGIAAGVVVGFLVLDVLGTSLGEPIMAALGGAGAIALLGSLDDIRSIPARYRLMIQGSVAAAVVYELGGIAKVPLPPPLDLPLGWLGAPLAVLWLMTVTNFFNFMDGLDGLAGGQAVVTCAGVALAAWAFGATEIAVIVAAATCGFLVLNIPPARLFLGDVGSTALGFSMGVMPLLAPPPERHRAVLMVVIALALFLLDPIGTLVRRIRGGHRPGVAHRSHFYQRIARGVGSHAPVTSSLLLCGAVLSVSSGLSYRWHGPTWLLVAFGLAAFGAEWLVANRLRDAHEHD